MLLLLELSRGDIATLRPLASSMSLTIQTVSEYLRQMTEEGLVERREGFYRPTQQGIAYLQQTFGRITEFITDQRKALAIIDTAVAIAGAPIVAAQPVGLFMEQGRLVARPGRHSPSLGVALHGAKPLREVVVGRLEGIVNLEPATLSLLALPSAHDGGSAALDLAAVRIQLRPLLRTTGVRCYGIGPVAEVVMRALRLDGPPDAAIEQAALELTARGVPVLVLLEETAVHDLLGLLEATNRTLQRRIPYQVLVAHPKGKGRGR